VIETSGTGAGELDTYELVTEWWNAIGVKTELRQETREVFWDRAGANEVMVATWTTDRGLVPMVDPIYQFPFDERSWMGPAFGMWYKSGGTQGEEPPAHIRAAMDLYDEYRRTTDPARQLEIGKEIVKMATEQLWAIGTVGLVPNPVVVKDNFMNVGAEHTADWIIMTPGTQDPAHYYSADGSQSQSRARHCPDAAPCGARSWPLHAGDHPMVSYVLRRVLTMVPMLLIFPFISFVIIQLPPGD